MREINFHKAYLAVIAIVAIVLFAIVWDRLNNKQQREAVSV
jgi:uncharacterized membrane protein YhhN